MSLTANINSSATNVPVDTVAGLPGAFPYTVILNPGGVTEEIMTVNSVSGTTLIGLRGQDGTTASSHSTGEPVRHGATARDLSEPQVHINANSGVHGTGGRVVGDTDTMTLTNKTMSGAANNFSNIPKAAIPSDIVYTTGAQTLTGKSLAGDANNLTNLDASQLVQGTVAKARQASDTVYLNDTQTLTGKTISGGSNTLSAIPDSAITALSGSKLTGTNNVPKSVLPADTVYNSADVSITGNLTVSGTVTAPHIPKEVLAIRTSASSAGIASQGTTSFSILWSTYTTKTFAHAPIVIVGLATQPGGSSMVTARANNVTTTGCDIITNNPGSSTAVFTALEYDILVVEATSSAAVG